MDVKAVFIFWGVLLNCHVLVLAGVQCYSCPKTRGNQTCDRFITCSDNEVCFSRLSIDSNLQEYYTHGCQHRDVCAQSSFSLIGKKRYVASAHAHSRRASSGDRPLCLKCCHSNLCNAYLCGSTPSLHVKRCFECQDVNKPDECDRISECDPRYECFTNFALNHATFEYRYSMGCIPELQCRAIAGHFTNGCVRCCNDRDYCNINLCDNYTSQSASSMAPVKTTPMVITTKRTNIAPPVVVITPSSSIQKLYSQTVKASCISDPGVMIRWRYANSHGLPAGVTADSSNRNLVISHLNETNAGVYECLGISKTGAIATAFLTVKIQDTPAIVISVDKSPPGLPVPGGKLILHCNVIGYPLPSITWSFTDKNGHVTIPYSVEYSNMNRDLTVKHYASIHNDGKWTCSARNRLGQSQSHTFVP